MSGASAQALMVHKFKDSFGSEGSSAGQFSKPYGVAVNSSTHDVYVVDRGNNRVEYFSSAGAYLGVFDGSGTLAGEEKAAGSGGQIGEVSTGRFSGPTQIAVDNSGDPLMDPSAGDVYVVDRGHGVIDKYSATGAYVGQITGADTPGGRFEPGETVTRSIKGVAVDPNGVVWVTTKTSAIYSFSDALISKYSPPPVETAFGGAVEGLAVDSEDNLYFNVGGGRFAKVDSSGEILSSPFGGDTNAFGVALDPNGREVYLDSRGSVEAFDLSGVPIESDQSGTAFPSFGSGLLTFSPGLGVDAGNGTVYASDQTLDKVFVFEGIVLPDVSVGAITEQQTRSLTLNGTVNPEGRPVTSCVFEYDVRPYARGEVAHGSSVACSPAPGSGSSPMPVSAHLEGLTPRSTYYYRLVAENSGGKSPSPGQQVFTGPILDGQWTVEAGANSTTLQASIDPNGSDTHYYFLYGQTSAYGSYAPVEAPGVDLGSVAGARIVNVPLQDLEAGIVYHYSLVVVQSGEAFEAEDHTFTTQPEGTASGLPDGRAWELVSPANKKGALFELFEHGGQVQAANDGSGIAYVTKGPSAGEAPAGKASYTPVLSRRDGSSWRSDDLSLPGRFPENGEGGVNITFFHFEYRQFTPDLSIAAVEPQFEGTPPLSEGVTERTLYLRNNPAQSFSPLVTAANVPPGSVIEEPNFHGVNESEWEMMFLAATPNLGSVVFKTPKALTADAIDEETVQDHVDSYVQWNLYEWRAGALSLVNILPNGEVAHGRYPSKPTVTLADVVDAGGRGRGGTQRAVSDDGRRVAWAWGNPYTPSELPLYRGLYVRDMVEGHTVRIGGASAKYETMSSDGSRIFYIENGDLYVYEWAPGETSGAAVDLTGSHGTEPSGGVSELVSNVSDDGSYVYFVASGVLAAGGIKGENNLYLLHDTSGGWATSYISTLSNEDKPSWYAENYGAPFPARISSRVSPNGRFLVFMSDRSLTGYDNTDVVSGRPDEEVFLYDANSGRLACVSCDPTGARPTGVHDTEASELLVDRLSVWTEKETTESDPHTDHWLAGSVPGWDDLGRDPATYQPRYLSDSGRVFFDSPVGLVAADSNGLEDVYEFEPVGVGDCSNVTASSVMVFVPASDGCVGLVSSGTSGSESAFYDASENGNDVFFDTTGKLTGADYDKAYDLYDAHVCSSSVPCASEAVVPPPCASGDSCKGAPLPQPEIFGPAASATFAGAGNVTSAPAVVVKPRSLTSRQKLARALRACRKQKRARRGACERRARKRYPLKRAGKTAATGKGRGR